MMIFVVIDIYVMYNLSPNSSETDIKKVNEKVSG